MDEENKPILDFVRTYWRTIIKRDEQGITIIPRTIKDLSELTDIPFKILLPKVNLYVNSYIRSIEEVKEKYKKGEDETIH